MACNFEHELILWRSGLRRVAGIDEAGRGALAGPVVAAAVSLPESYRNTRLDDSKKLSPAVRESLYLELTGRSDVVWSVAVMDSTAIDQMNILRATHQAMRMAVLGLPTPCEFALIDGLPVHPFPIQQQALVGGDGRSLSIAAASILAKVTRDRLMVQMETDYPRYDFARHKGYATALHLAKLREHGPCAIHRRSFEPVAQRSFDF